MIGQIKRRLQYLRRWLSHRSQNKSLLTPAHIRWAYRLLLDREPEDDRIPFDVATHLPTTQALRRAILNSEEFRTKNPGIIGPGSPSIPVMTELPSGVRIWLDLTDVVVGLNITRCTYEVEELSYVNSIIQPGQNVLDLGANIGFYTLHLAQLVGPQGHVVAFEPLPRNLAFLERSLKENSFPAHVMIVPQAVGAKAGEAYLLYQIHTENMGGGFLVDEPIALPNDTHALHPVVIVALDEQELPRPIHFIKMDIEGAEPQACRGADALLHTDRPRVLAEINPEGLAKVSHCTPADFIGEMQARGYQCHLLQEGRPGPEIMTTDQFCSVVFVPAP